MSFKTMSAGGQFVTKKLLAAETMPASFRQANIWDWTSVASGKTVAAAIEEFDSDETDLRKNGKNALARNLIPNTRPSP
jgi:acetyl esterase/lipase